MKSGLVCAALALALLAALASSVEGATWKVKFQLASLDGEPGNEHTGTVVIEVHDEWAPLGAARFREMVEADFFTGVRFFRVIKGFVAQFGIHGNPQKAAEWREKKILDDPVKETNARGTLVFATSGKNTRTTQLFINFADNANLDGMGFSPFARVVEGMDIVDRIFMVGEKPNQGEIQASGNSYLKKNFPRLTYITKARIVGGGDL